MRSTSGDGRVSKDNLWLIADDGGDRRRSGAGPDVADLKRWLAEVGLTELADTLAANDIGIDILSALTDADLREIGLTLGQRKRLLKAAAGLAGDVAAPAAARASRTAGEGERRQMTILFCDMVGSTQLTSRLDPEDMFQVVATYQRSCAEVIQRFGGHVAKYLGDGVLAHFGFPQAHEDDAERAVRAGLELTAVIRTLAVRPAVNL